MIDVLIVDDHTIFRSGVRRLLSDEPDMRITDEARNGVEALAKLRARPMGVVLLDINMAGRSGLDVLAQIRDEWPRLPVIMLSMYPEDQYALVALRAGANGYVSKDMESSDLVGAIRAVAAGGKYMSSQVMQDLWRPQEAPPDQPPHHRLSARELHVMLQIVRGTSLTDIGSQLCLSVKTISTYRTRILEKLNLSSNADLVRYAIGHRLTE